MRLTEKINGRYYGKANNHIASKPLMEKLGQYEDIDENPENLAKIKKALEIIKNKGVFVHLLQQSQNVEEYNSLMLIAFKKKAERDYKGAVEKFCLTQEEFDLLKELLYNN